MVTRPSMTPILPEPLRGDLPFSTGAVPVAGLVDKLVVCRTRSGQRAVFTPEVITAEAEAGAGQQLHLKNFTLFDGAAAFVRKSRHERVLSGLAHDLSAGGNGDSGDLRWSPAGVNPGAELIDGELVPAGGAALAVVELEALALPAAAFVPTSPGPRFINFGSFIQGLGVHDPQSGAWRQDAGGEVYFLAPVYLPQRCSLISAEFYIADHSEADGCDICARLDRLDRRGGVHELLRVRSRGARGRQDLAHSGIIGLSVDNNADAFHIHVTWQFPPTPHQQDLRLYGARVRFMPKVPAIVGAR